MNRGVCQSSPVQQMMRGGMWSVNNIRPPTQQTSPFLPSSATSSSSAFPHQYPYPTCSIPLAPWLDNQELPQSWSQLLLGGSVGEEDRRSSFTPFPPKKLENWAQNPVIYQSVDANMAGVKQEVSESGYLYDGHGNEEAHVSRSSWSQVLPVSSPSSCITGFSSNMLDFSNQKVDDVRHPKPDLSPECNSTTTGSAFKRTRVQNSSLSSQSTFKVKKEKLGDRITVLHQLVSPFGKTDTASVLLEAIGYIRFLQGQIEALSSPYTGNAPGKTRKPDADQEEQKRDLRSRGLCLVPVSCTSLHVGSETGADYWAPGIGSAFR